MRRTTLVLSTSLKAGNFPPCLSPLFAIIVVHRVIGQKSPDPRVFLSWI